MSNLVDQAVIASTVVSAAGTVTKQVDTAGARSCVVVINVTAFSTGTLTVTVSGLSAQGVPWTILASTALAAVATTTLKIGPGLPVAANASANDVVPGNLQISAAAATSPSLTYTIDIEYGY